MCDQWIATSSNNLVTVSQRTQISIGSMGWKCKCRRIDPTYVSVQASAGVVVVGAGGGVVLQSQLVVGGRVVQPQGSWVFMIA